MKKYIYKGITGCIIDMIATPPLVTINLTEQNARALQDALRKFTDKDNAHMLGERKFTPPISAPFALSR